MISANVFLTFLDTSFLNISTPSVAILVLTSSGKTSHNNGKVSTHALLTCQIVSRENVRYSGSYK